MTAGAAPAVRADTLVVAAGDIACGPDYAAFAGGLGTFGENPQCHQRYTSDLLDALGPAVVLALGDTQYGRADLADYLAAYDQRDPDGTPVSWGRAKAITRPVPGNHEYTHTDPATGAYTGAAGYFDYFNGPGVFSGPAGDRDKGYYSFDVTTETRPDGSAIRWHLVALNSECASEPPVAAAVGWLGGCAAGSPQERWLRTDLAAASAAGIDCTLAYWHHPLFSASGPTGGDPAVRPLWQALYDYDADVVLNGHHHVYQRFQPLSPAGDPAPGRGMREFVVGTGGRILGLNRRPDARLEAFDATSFGVLALTLGDGRYAWRFVPDGRSGTFTDAGTDACVRLHATVTSGPPALGRDRSPQFAFTASRPASGFQCRLDGAAWMACASPARSGAVADGTHLFEVRALDPSGAPSAAAGHAFTVDATPPGVSLTTPAPGATVAGRVSVRAAAADALGVARVEWTVDGTQLAADATAPYGQRWDTRRVPDGIHRLRAVAYDRAGNAAHTPAVPVRVRNDRTPPRAAVAPVTGQGLRTVLRRGLRLRVRCSEACRVGAELRLSRPLARRLRVPERVGRAARAAPAGRPAVIRIRLSRRAEARLRRLPAVQVRVRVTAADASGNTRVAARSLRLR
jgi:Big-like domain-containing protein/calcineurin-like phosphoesterase family protein